MQKYFITLNPRLTHKEHGLHCAAPTLCAPSQEITRVAPDARVEAVRIHFIWHSFYEWCLHNEANMVLA